MIRHSFAKTVLEPIRIILRDPLAVAGLVILACVIFMALAAPLIATHDPMAIAEDEDASVLERPLADLGDGGAWTLRPSLGPVAISGADATATADGNRFVLAVGRDGTAHRYEDGQWDSFSLPAAVDLNGVALRSPERGLVVGAGGTILVLRDGDWHPIDAGVSVELRGVAWIDDDLALVVGADETILELHFANGDMAVTRLDSPVGRGMSLNAVAAGPDGRALMVGERGIALRYAPETDGDAVLTLERMPTFRDFNGISIASDGATLIVGERGTLVRSVADGWVEDDAPDSRALRAGWIAEGGERAVAVGRSGIVMEFDGARWVLADTGTDRHFRTVAATHDQLFALGTDLFVNRLAPPSRDHWFGTDHLGRDLFSQNVYGSQIALLVGFLGASLVVLIGANVGLIAGYFRGRTETVLMRTVDVMYGIPFEPFALILVLLFDPSLTIVILAVSLLTWRTVARLIRSQVLSLSERPFVKAARVAGASDLRIMYLHIFPNVLPLVFLELAIIVGVSIIAEATLSFLGLGPPQSISWGGILHNARLSGAWRTAWWWNIPPGVFIMLTVLSVFFISRSLEVIANPRLRAR